MSSTQRNKIVWIYGYWGERSLFWVVGIELMRQVCVLRWNGNLTTVWKSRSNNYIWLITAILEWQDKRLLIAFERKNICIYFLNSPRTDRKFCKRLLKRAEINLTFLSRVTNIKGLFNPTAMLANCKSLSLQTPALMLLERSPYKNKTKQNKK